jgi:hypothetical protein
MYVMRSSPVATLADLDDLNAQAEGWCNRAADRRCPEDRHYRTAHRRVINELPEESQKLQSA